MGAIKLKRANIIRCFQNFNTYRTEYLGVRGRREGVSRVRFKSTSTLGNGDLTVHQSGSEHARATLDLRVLLG